MKVALFYNEAAGDGVTLGELRATLTSGGHQLVRIVDRHADLGRLLDAEAELVVAAGSGESHPTDVAFGTRIVELLASAQKQLSAGR